MTIQTHDVLKLKLMFKNALIVPCNYLISLFCRNREQRHKLRDFRFYPEFPAIQTPRVFMTLLVKNDADILEHNLRFHQAMGIDGIIATDNGSTDGTIEILEKYRANGLVKEIIHDSSCDYRQAAFVDRMIRLAIDKYHPDWIINADADEFFYSKKGNYKEVFSQFRHNAYYCFSHAMFSENETVSDAPSECYYRVMKTVKKDPKLARHSIYKIGRKILHRAEGYRMICGGNHGVKMEITSEAYTDDIVIYHYMYRGYPHFCRKVINGGRVLEGHPLREGSHWHYYYNLYQTEGEEALKKIYASVIGLNKLHNLIYTGTVRSDLTMINFLRNLDSRNG